MLEKEEWEATEVDVHQIVMGDVRRP